MAYSSLTICKLPYPKNVFYFKINFELTVYLGKDQVLISLNLSFWIHFSPFPWKPGAGFTAW
jgi:hypothetical protein